jgi:hypothetical protein
MTEHRAVPLGPIIGTAMGLPALTYGIWGLLADSELTHPPAALTWIVAGNLTTDLILLPTLVALTYVASRALPRWTRPTVRLAVAISAILTLVAYPLIANYGAKPDNPSLLPRNATAGLLAYLAIVWTIATATLLLRRPSPDADRRGVLTRLRGKG